MREINRRKQDHYTRSVTVLWFCPEILFKVIRHVPPHTADMNEQVKLAVTEKVKVKLPLSTP